MNIHGIILAGGAGTRFWPLSRQARPKQLIPLLNGRTTLEVTAERLQPLIPLPNLMVITNRQQAKDVAVNLRDYLEPEQIIAEPCGRNTAPAIALAAELLREKAGEEAVMMVFPADHFIGELESFHRHLLRAAECAADGSLVTLGIKPNRPETGYGYIQGGAPLPNSETIPEISACRVARFVEKPDYRTAAAYLMDGGYFWNSGIFIWQVGSILREIAALTPNLDLALQEFRKTRLQQGLEKALEIFYDRVVPISIDVAIIEKSNRVTVIPATFPWSDLGSWDALDELNLAPFSAPPRVINCEATDNTVFSNKLTALVEVENLLVIESDDALLICRKGSSQQVREIVAELQRQGLEEFL
jgi:mannose-1-phosphate guanylyltransferase/mannose-6-phosphate isomerase